MVRIENHCCDCAVPGYPCQGALCSLTHVEVTYCDCCGGEISGYDDIYDVDDKEVCEYCLLDMFRREK